MNRQEREMQTYALSGSSDIDRRMALVTELLSNAEVKANHLAELRSKNMNYALLAFAALFTVSLKWFESNTLYSLLASVALVVIMAVFCLWDFRLHKHIHGWRQTRKDFVKLLTELLNEPEMNTTFVRYNKHGEKSAEKLSFQPCIFYLLIMGGFGHFVFSFYNLVMK